MKSNILIVFLVLIILGLGGYIAYDKYMVKDETEGLKDEIKMLKSEINNLKENSNDAIIVSNLYGTYVWSKDYEDNVSGSRLKLRYDVKLVLNSDGTATYDAANGIESEQTKGSFKYEDGKIIYTREYYNYDTPESSSAFEGDSKIETFIVIDKNTLQNNYYDQKTELKKQN